MTSSINLKKIISVGAAALLAIGGALGAGAPASATGGLGLTSAPTMSPSTGVTVTTSLSATNGVWTNAPLGTGGGFGIWKICDSAPVTASSLDGNDVPSSWNCHTVYTSLSGANPYTGTSFSVQNVTALDSQSGTVSPAGMIGKYVARFEYVKLASSPFTLYGWAFSNAALISAAPTMTGTSGNLNGTVGTALNMSAYQTTGLTSPVVYSISVTNGSLPSGVTFDTTTGQLVGTPTAAVSNLGVTITATGANTLTISSGFNFTVTSGGGGGGGGGSSYTITSPASYSITNGVATANDGTWSGGTPTRFWVLCNNPHTTPATSIHMDCFPMALTQNGSDERGTTVTLANDVWMGFSGTRTQVAFSSKYFGLYVQNGGTQYVTATTAGSPVTAPSAPVLTPEQARKQVKPLPTIVQPLVAALPNLNKPMVNAGGKLDLSAGDFSGLVSASISGKPLDLTLGAKGGLTITVPNGEAGKTADLTLKFSTGTVIIQDAIKYVAPLVVADVPTRPVSIAAGSTKLTDATADQVRQAAFANMKNTTVSCVAYAANGSAAARAAAQATAEQVCALATKSNPALTATPVTVIVDKAKAKTEAVGIKVYKN